MSFLVEVQKGGIQGTVADVLIVPLNKEDLKSLSIFDELTGGAVSRLIDHKDFEAKPNQVIILPTVRGSNVKRVCLLGLGERKSFSDKVWYKGLSTATIASQRKKANSLALFSDKQYEKKLGPTQLGLLSSKAVVVASYCFDKYRTKKDRKVIIPKSLIITNISDVRRVTKGAKDGLTIGESVNFTRDLGNHPAGDMTPTSLSQEVKEKFKGLPVKVRVFDEERMTRLKMGGILGVSKGSQEEAKMVILEYQGASKDKPWIVFCGKGITFDSGGISLKPSGAMDEMKFDMLGAGTVAGGIYSIAKLGIQANVVGILACAENLPSGSALRPGDILTAMNKKTIEVLNTDAEGRLVLADALSYAARYKPKYVVDFATLTGACVVALGSHYAGLFSLEEKLKEKIMKASKASGDKVWELPVTSEYSEHVKSNVADVKNIGRKGEAGASSAAAFLKEFTSYPWAHIDVAGAAWSTKDLPGLHCGATGFGVHLMVQLVTLTK